MVVSSLSRTIISISYNSGLSRVNYGGKSLFNCSSFPICLHLWITQSWLRYTKIGLFYKGVLVLLFNRYNTGLVDTMVKELITGIQGNLDIVGFLR